MTVCLSPHVIIYLGSHSVVCLYFVLRRDSTDVMLRQLVGNMRGVGGAYEADFKKRR